MHRFFVCQVGGLGQLRREFDEIALPGSPKIWLWVDLFYGIRIWAYKIFFKNNSTSKQPASVADQAERRKHNHYIFFL